MSEGWVARCVEERRVDLHCHTNVSDGTLTPTQLVELAARKGLAAIAITDHDVLGALPEAKLAGDRLGVEIVPGVELSTTHGGIADLHLLGYFVDPDEPRLATRLATFRAVRAARKGRIIDKLRELGVDVREDELPDAESIGRPHIARLLVEKGIVKSIQEAFDVYLAEGKPANVPKARIEAAEAIALVHGAGGVAVLAHPGLVKDGLGLRAASELVAAGLDGIEVEHSKHDSDTRRRLRELCQKHGLVETGGSDFHGENKPDVDLGYGHGGNVRVTTATLEALRARAALRRG